MAVVVSFSEPKTNQTLTTFHQPVPVYPLSFSLSLASFPNDTKKPPSWPVWFIRSPSFLHVSTGPRSSFGLSAFRKIDHAAFDRYSETCLINLRKFLHFPSDLTCTYVPTRHAYLIFVLLNAGKSQNSSPPGSPLWSTPTFYNKLEFNHVCWVFGSLQIWPSQDVWHSKVNTKTNNPGCGGWDGKDKVHHAHVCVRISVWMEAFSFSSLAILDLKRSSYYSNNLFFSLYIWNWGLFLLFIFLFFYCFSSNPRPSIRLWE